MNLKEYQQNLKNALLKNSYNKVQVDNKVIKGGGSFVNQKPLFDTGIIGPSSYGEDVRQFQHLYNSVIRPKTREVFKQPITTGRKPRKTKLSPKPLYPDSDSDDDSDNDDNNNVLVQGGKMNFIKSLKGIGNTVGKVVLSESLKPVGRAIGDSIVSSGKALFNPATMATVGEGALEEAPLVLAAAGVKKKRQVSEKTKRRHELIKKLMKQHHCSLADANSYISKHNLKY